MPFVCIQCLGGIVLLGACSYCTCGGVLEVHDYYALTASSFSLRHYDLLEFFVHSTSVHFFFLYVCEEEHMASRLKSAHSSVNSDSN